MASTFAELFSDYQNLAKVYTEKLDFTPFQFMRDFTRGMQKFQRETEYIERLQTIQRNQNNLFQLPQDCLRIIEIRDEDGQIILEQDYRQFRRNVDKYDLGYVDTPARYTYRIRKLVFPDGLPGNIPVQRMWAVFDRFLYIYPAYNGNSLNIYYIPDIDVFSATSNQWSGWFVPNAFTALFNTARVTPPLAPYEDAFVKYALMEYIRSKGSINYRIFENEFLMEVEKAKLNKPLYYREGTADYRFSPWS